MFNLIRKYKRKSIKNNSGFGLTESIISIVLLSVLISYSIIFISKRQETLYRANLTSAINDEIDRLRHSATRSLLEREDVIVISSVSCIYGIGSPEEYSGMKLTLFSGDTYEKKDLLNELVRMQYERNDLDFSRGAFRVRGDIVEIFPSHEESNLLRVEFFDDEIETLEIVDPISGEIIEELKVYFIDVDNIKY